VLLFLSNDIAGYVISISLGIFFGGLIVGAILLRRDPGHLPNDCRTLGDLARRTAISSYGRLVKMGVA
jgi:hypothetical protein